MTTPMTSYPTKKVLLLRPIYIFAFDVLVSISCLLLLFFIQQQVQQINNHILTPNNIAVLLFSMFTAFIPVLLGEFILSYRYIKQQKNIHHLKKDSLNLAGQSLICFVVINVLLSMIYTLFNGQLNVLLVLLVIMGLSVIHALNASLAGLLCLPKSSK